MEVKSSASSQKHDGEGVVAKDLKGKSMIGDITWVKLSSGIWWPALVVGNNSNLSNEDSDGLTKDVRVRLYGSCEYMLVDPTKWRSEFQIILAENNGSCQEIFRKALEQDILQSEYDQMRGKRSKSKGASNGKVSQKRTTSDHDGELSGRSPELSARRIKVMQTLGLAAPSGSPFQN